MKTARMLIDLCTLATVALGGCNLPGKPKPGPEVPRPEEVTSFEQLYSRNCSGCHGEKGDHGGAMNLANPEYQALIDDASLREMIAYGEKGTLMPAFAMESGGTLTNQQIDAIVQGMRANWRKPLQAQGPVASNSGAGALPPYRATHAGEPAKGAAVYMGMCAECHGSSARKPGKAGSILDGSFLALVNEQMIRTTIIAGRPDLGMPDWRGHSDAPPMTDDEITNVTAWLMAQKSVRPGQPYPSVSPTKAGEKQPSAEKR
jgi:cytochrome c oxidase cbb3-type subunit 3